MKDHDSLRTYGLFPLRKQLLMNLLYKKGGDGSLLILIISYIMKFPAAFPLRHQAHSFKGKG